MSPQKLHFKLENEIELANRYYTILVSLNKIPVTAREIQLVSFTSVKGNISYKAHREEFCEIYKTSMATINNMISKLKRLKLLIKDGDKGVKINPVIRMDFSKGINLNIILENEAQ